MSPHVQPDSAPSLRAIEVACVPGSSRRDESPEEAELADEFGADRTPAGILVDRAAIGRPRSAARRALPLASAAIVATLGIALWWQPARTGTAAAPASEPAALERVVEPEPEATPERVVDTEPEATPERVVEPEPEPAALAPAREPAPEVREVAYDAQRLDFALRWARMHAERCHLGGRAVGTAQLSITFSPAGKVTAFRVTGEPIASAPVARCVASYFQSMLIPPFAGEAFTVHETLTLR